MQFLFADDTKGPVAQRRVERQRFWSNLEIKEARFLKEVRLLPGQMRSFGELQDPNKRPPVPREEVSDDFFR